MAVRWAAPLLALLVGAALAVWLWQSSLSRDERKAVPPPASVPAARDGSTFSPTIRVNLTGDVTRVRIAVDGPFHVRSLGGGRTLLRAESLEPAELRAAGSGLRLGNRSLSAARVEVVPERSPSVWIDGHQYRGTVRLLRRAGGKLLAVNAVPLEEYVASVVDSEMPRKFGRAARRAQAIVARTYALYQRQQRGGRGEYDVFDDSRSQKYLGFQYRTKGGRRLAGESDDSRRCARDTAGMICVRNGRIFCTYYSAVCGGNTMRGGAVFDDARSLRSVRCRWCRPAERYRWQTELGKSEIGRALGVSETSSRLVARNEDPAAPTVLQVLSGGRSRRMDGVEARRRLPAGTLHSPRFEVRRDGNRFVFHGRGHGHGVGLCQWGAAGQGAAGRTCLEILQHYYPGANVVALQKP